MVMAIEDKCTTDTYHTIDEITDTGYQSFFQQQEVLKKRATDIFDYIVNNGKKPGDRGYITPDEITFEEDSVSVQYMDGQA